MRGSCHSVRESSEEAFEKGEMDGPVVVEVRNVPRLHPDTLVCRVEGKTGIFMISR